MMVGLSSVVALGACQGEPKGPVKADQDAPEPQVPVADAVTEVRACDSGGVVAVDYLSRDQIRLTHKDRVWTLDRVPTGQGLHFSTQGADWTVVTQAGEEVARLTLMGADKKPVVAELCRRPAPQLATLPKHRAMKPCISPDLAYGVEAGDAGMGHRLTTIRVENRGPAPCQLDGAPQVSLLRADGQALSQIKAEARTEGYFGQVRAAVPILLQPSDKAYFDLGWSVVPHETMGEKACPEATGLRLAPPGDSGGKSLPLAIAPCGGKIEVSPYRPVVDRQASGQTVP